MLTRSLEGATRAGTSLTVRWDEPFWVAARATLETLAETGMRKADVSKPTAGTPFKRGRLTFASLRWQLGGVRTATPTRAQLEAAGSHPGDGCWLVFGALKNDAYGERFGSKPSWLPYSATLSRCACRSLVALELLAIDAGVHGGQRGVTPLFGPCVGIEWHHSQLEQVFDLLLEVGCGLDATARKAFSLHSFRIFLACALYAAGCPNDRIMAILRWRSEESLTIYARMNDAERTGWVLKAGAQIVDSSVAAHLPRVDADDYIARLHEAVQSGELGRIARAADAGTLVGYGDAPPAPPVAPAAVVPPTPRAAPPRPHVVAVADVGAPAVTVMARVSAWPPPTGPLRGADARAHAPTPPPRPPVVHTSPFASPSPMRGSLV